LRAADGHHQRLHDPDPAQRRRRHQGHPITGVTLSFISQGGSSLLVTCVALGLVLAISDGEPKPLQKRTAPARTASTRRRPASAA
jgi:hypothetical protein